jgi:hypothetical protein
MSRTKREPFKWIEWLEGFEEKVKRDGVKREPPTHRRTASNRGWVTDGIWTAKGKRWFKRRRNKDDRLEMDRMMEKDVKEVEDT